MHKVMESDDDGTLRLIWRRHISALITLAISRRATDAIVFRSATTPSRGVCAIAVRLMSAARLLLVDAAMLPLPSLTLPRYVTPR